MDKCASSLVERIVSSQLMSLTTLLSDNMSFDNKSRVIDVLINARLRIGRLLDPATASLYSSSSSSSSSEPTTTSSKSRSEPVVGKRKRVTDDDEDEDDCAIAKPSYSASSGWQTTAASKPFYSGRNPNSNGKLTESERASVEHAMFATIATVHPPPASPSPSPSPASPPPSPVPPEQEHEHEHDYSSSSGTYIVPIRRTYGPPGEEMDTEALYTAPVTAQTTSSTL
jgi:hypothetical protein